MTKKAARDYVGHVGMSKRPAYYSGHGARRGDLSAKQLLGIYDQILEHEGIGPALEFIKMVGSLKSLGATPFLEELYRLQYNGWIFKPGDPPKDWAIDGRMEDGSLQASALCAIFQAMAGPARDETSSDFYIGLRAKGAPDVEGVLDKLAMVKSWDVAMHALGQNIHEIG